MGLFFTPRRAVTFCFSSNYLRLRITSIPFSMSESVNISYGKKNHDSELCSQCTRILKTIAEDKNDKNESSSLTLTYDQVFKGYIFARFKCALCQFLNDNSPQSGGWDNWAISDVYCRQYKADEIIGGLDTDAERYWILKPGWSPEASTILKLRIAYEEDENFASRGIEISRLFSTPRSYQNISPSPFTDIYETRKSLMKTWISTCVEDHTVCSQSVNFLPSRLIDISLASRPRLKVFDHPRDPKQPRLKYVTLSHCWGEGVSFKLHSKNLKNMQEGIDIAILSKTFQDAIVVAQQLDIQYIWIDSLCILQDNLEDWLLESNLMGEIYANSHCTIAAASASNGSVGLFLDAAASSCHRIRFGGADYDFQLGNCWYNLVEKSPLMRRAWVFQERLLSHRILHFTTHGVFFECKQNRVGEDYSSSFLNQDEGFSLKEILSLATDRAQTKYLLDLIGIYWLSLAQRYSTCGLTVKTDQLPAIAGLAKDFQMSLGDVGYLAGLWRAGLEYQLLWSVCFPYTNSTSTLYIAPSWSWASISGSEIDWTFLYGKEFEPIVTFFQQDKHHLLICILDAEVELASINKFGQVSGGHINMQGYLIRKDLWLYYENPDDTTRPFLWPDSVAIYENYLLEEPGTLSDKWRLVNSTPLGVYFMPFIIDPESAFCHGLMLVANEESDGCATFRRFGVFKMILESYIDQESVGLLAALPGGNPDAFNLELDQPCITLSQKSFKDFDNLRDSSGLEYIDDGKGGFKYIITIV